jgi:misacylated tRNA(Ala) deacylase
MSRAFYHLHPDTLSLEAEVVDAQPGRVALTRSPFFAGGGGQLADRGVIRGSDGEVAVAGFDSFAGRSWILLAEPVALSGAVEAVVDEPFRTMMRQLHTGTHILNAVIFQGFDGALVTGVQMNEDGTARMDFDLPNADSERLRGVEALINTAIRRDLAVTDSYVPLDTAMDEPGLIRTRTAMPPPTSDGLVRIVEIAGLDRQACGGTHLASTGGIPPIRLIKIDNKGRHNRRLRIGLVGGAWER